MKKISALLMALIFAIPGLFAQSELKLMFSSMAGLAPQPSATDESIPLSSTPGIYEGVVTMKKSASFAFYSGSPGASDFTRYSSNGYVNISFKDGELIWPVGSEPGAGAKIIENSDFPYINWSIANFSEYDEKTAQVKVTVNLNNMTLRLEQEPFLDYPAAIYLWGSEDGGRSFKVMATLNPSDENPTVYKAEFYVPEVAEFPEADDPEFGGIEGAPDHGFVFLLCKSGESLSGGQIYNGEPEDYVYEFGGDVTSLTKNILKGTGNSIFDLTPGYTSFTFDYLTKELTLSLIDNDELPDSIKLYVMQSSNNWTPQDDDPVLIYNPETGYYEGATFHIAKGGAFKFYKKEDDGTSTIIGNLFVAQIQFNVQNPYINQFEEGSSGWLISKFYNPEDKEGIISLAVDLENLTIVVKQEDAIEKIPDILYLWGSTDGLANGQYYNMGTLLPEDNNPMVFTTLFEVPDCPGPFVYDDPEFSPTEEDAPTSGFMFILSPEKDKLNKSNVVRYGGLVNSRTINMEDGETAASIQLFRNNGGPVIDMTPGLSLITFDLQTLELSVVLQNEIDPDDPSLVAGNISDEATTFTVYTLQGVKVMKDAAPERIGDLTPGMYIVNGRKVIVK